MLSTQTNEIALSLLPEIRSMFERLGVRGDELDDAMQESFLLLVTYVLPRYDGTGKLRTYALAMVRKRWLNSRTVGFARYQASGETLDAMEGPEGFAAFERAIEAQSIRVAMERLTERERELLAAFEDCQSWGEAGLRIGVSKPTATRLRVSIREKLAA